METEKLKKKKQWLDEKKVSLTAKCTLTSIKLLSELKETEQFFLEKTPGGTPCQLRELLRKLGLLHEAQLVLLHVVRRLSAGTTRSHMKAGFVGP